MSFFKTPPPYDQAADARSIAGAALSSFSSVLADLDHSSQLLDEVAAQESVKATVATQAASAAQRDSVYNNAVAGRIRTILGEPSDPQNHPF